MVIAAAALTSFSHWIINACTTGCKCNELRDAGDHMCLSGRSLNRRSEGKLSVCVRVSWMVG